MIILYEWGEQAVCWSRSGYWVKFRVCYGQSIATVKEIGGKN